jgi:ketosteroid isomerase-like protein
MLRDHFKREAPRVGVVRYRDTGHLRPILLSFTRSGSARCFSGRFAMRTLLVCTIVAGGCMAIPPAIAQQEGRPQEIPDSHAAGDDLAESDHAALREFKALFEKAASENDLELLRPILHQPFSVVTYTDREFTDFDEFKTRWQKTRDEIVGDGSYRVTLLPERSELYGDLAIARGDSESTLVTAAGNEYEFTSHWTAVFRRQNGQWKVVRVHSSLDPFGNPMVVGEVKRRMTQTGLAAGLGGLLLGGLVAWGFARRGRSA